MADQVDTLSIGVELALADARRAYEAFKRDIESNPFKVDLALQGTKSDGGRTFSGATTAIGPENFRRPDQRPQTPSLAQTMDAAMVQRNVMGGTGFGPAVGPLPTAGVNSVYGGISPGVALSPVERSAVFNSGTGVAHTDQEYGRYRVRAVRAGIMDPMSRSAFDQEGGWQQAMSEIDFWNEQRARNRSDARMAQSSTAPKSAVAPRYRLREGESFGSQPGGMFFGGGFNAAVGIAGIATAALAGADSFVAANQRQRDVNRFDPLLDQAEKAYSQLSGTWGIKRWTGNIANNLREFTGDGRKFTDERAIDEAFNNVQMLRADAQTRAAKIVASAISAKTDMIGSSGFGAESLASRESVNVLIRDRQRDEYKNNPFLLESLNTRIAAQQVQDRVTQSDISTRANFAARQGFAAGRAAMLGGDNNPYASGVAGIIAQQDSERFEMARTTRGMNSADAATLRASMNFRQAAEMASFDSQYRRSAFAQTTSIQAGSAGEGFVGQSLALENRRVATMTMLPGYDAYQRGGAVSQADRNRIDATEQDFRMQRAAMTRQFTTNAMNTELQIAASQARMSGNPLGAAMLGIQAAFNNTTRDMSRDSFEFGQAQRARAQDETEASYNFGFGASQNFIGIAGGLRSTGYALQRNAVGAQAAGIASGAAASLRSFAMSGQRVNAELARTLGNEQLDLLSQEYRLSFRAQQEDLQNVMPFNPRDSQNPESVFSSIEEERAMLNGTSSDPDKIKADSLAEAVRQGLGISGDLATTIAQAIQRSLAN